MLKNRWKIGMVKIGDVIPQGDNPRTINPASLKGLRASVGRFGMVELVVWNKRTKHVVSGHQRLAILVQSGVDEAPMVIVDMSPEDELAASLTMNNPKIEGEFDEPVMELISQIETAAPDLFKMVRIDELKASLERDMERGGDGDSESDWDTECPCCKNRWKIGAENITAIAT